MITTVDIVVGGLVISCVVSAAFVLTRIYFCYFAKPKQIEAQKDARLEEMYCGKKEETAPVAKKRATRKKKTEQ